MIIRYFLIITTALLCACSLTSYSWEPVSYDTHAVWADDNSELAIGTTFFEQRESLEPLMGATEKRHFAYQLFLVKPDGRKRRSISARLPNQLENLYYMKKAGYLLAESYVAMTAAKQLYKIDLQGNATLIASILPLPEDECVENSFDNFFSPDINVTLMPTVIPSPDGQLIAHAYRADCHKVTVTFYSPDTLTILDKQIVTVTAGNYAVTWRKDGAFVVAKTDRSEALALFPKKPPATTAAPACFSPATRRSEVSSTGKIVRADATDIYVSEAGVAPTFGCQ
jgi:hypothetical protein